jgi:prophage DNA circulation protein
MMVFGAQILQLLVNAGVLDGNSRFLKKLLEILNLMNPIYFVVSLIITFIIEILESSGLISKKEADRGKMIGAMVAQVLTAVVMIVGAIAATILSGGAAAAPMALGIAQAIAGIISSALAITNSVFGIMKGVQQLKVAELVFASDMLKAAVESIRAALQSLTSMLDLAIQAMKDDTETLSMAFTNMSEIIKIEGDTKATIARNITI